MSLSRLIYCLLPCLLVGSCDTRKSSQSEYLFNGICDGSAAVRVGKDQILVASDEANALYLFDGGGGLLKRAYSLSEFLPDNAEMDLEAGVVHSGGVWWIGSHGLDSKANKAPNRRVLFKTSSPNANGDITLQSKMHNITELIVTALVENNIHDAIELAPKKGGINIEGLSVTLDGDLLIALRSPLSSGLRGDAIIMQITPQDDTFELVQSYLLTLSDKGVRDLAITNDGYLLIAGGVASGGSSSVFKWRRASEPRASELGASEPRAGELQELFTVPDGFNAEALLDMGSHWMLLSDDGNVKRPDNEAGDGDRRCEDIIGENTQGAVHRSVFFRALTFTPD